MATTLDTKAVRHVAELARLKMTDDEVALYADQLSKILQYIEQLDELDTTGVEPTAHAMPIANVFREDEVKPSFEADRALANAPQRQDAYFRVPKVLDQESA